MITVDFTQPLTRRRTLSKLGYEEMSDDEFTRPKPPRPGSDPNLSRTQLDSQLRIYLEDAARDKADGNTIAQLRADVHDARLEMHEQGRRIDELATEQKLMRLRQDRHGKDIRDLKEKVFHTDPTDEADTGVHQMKDLKEYLAKQEGEDKERRDSLWWRRKRWEIAIAAGGFLAANLVIGAVALIWYLLTHGR